MRNYRSTKLIAWLLTLIMVFNMTPVSAVAGGITTPLAVRECELKDIASVNESYNEQTGNLTRALDVDDDIEFPLQGRLFSLGREAPGISHLSMLLVREFQ